MCALSVHALASSTPKVFPIEPNPIPTTWPDTGCVRIPAIPPSEQLPPNPEDISSLAVRA